MVCNVFNLFFKTLSHLRCLGLSSLIQSVKADIDEHIGSPETSTRASTRKKVQPNFYGMNSFNHPLATTPISSSSASSSSSVSGHKNDDGDDAKQSQQLSRTISPKQKTRTQPTKRFLIGEFTEFPSVEDVPNYDSYVRRKLIIGSLEDRLQAHQYMSMASFCKDFYEMLNNGINITGDEEMVSELLGLMLYCLCF
jgi:hypothetical protein